jgi:hypothetical protein
MTTSRGPSATARDLDGNHPRVKEHTAMMNPTLTRPGKIRYGLAALLLGLPIPIVILAFLMPGCGN